METSRVLLKPSFWELSKGGKSFTIGQDFRSKQRRLLVEQLEHIYIYIYNKSRQEN